MVDLLTGILATWRLSNLLYADPDNPEVGPFEVFAQVRDVMGVKYDEQSHPTSDTQMGKMLLCFWCTSIWVALIVAVLQGKTNPVKVLAYSAGAILFRDLRGRLQ